MKIPKKCKQKLQILETVNPHIVVLVIAFRTFKDPKEYIRKHFSESTIKILIEKKYLTKSLNAGVKLKEVMARLEERWKTMESIKTGVERGKTGAAEKLLEYFKEIYRKKYGREYIPFRRNQVLSVLGIVLKQLGTMNEAKSFLQYYLETSSSPNLAYVDRWLERWFSKNGNRRAYRV